MQLMCIKFHLFIIMTYKLTPSAFAVEVIIDDNCGMSKFFSIANTLERKCKVRFTTKEDNSDTVDWFFIYKGNDLRLHYNIYNGVSICNNGSKGNVVLDKLAFILQNELF